MKRNFKYYLWITGAVLFFLGLFFWSRWVNTRPDKFDDLAKCLKDKGTIFYAAFWCPNCQNQKKIFGRSARFLPYVECSTPNGQGQLEVCRQAGVEAYPTWTFSSGTSTIGVLLPDELAEKSGCVYEDPYEKK